MNRDDAYTRAAQLYGHWYWAMTDVGNSIDRTPHLYEGDLGDFVDIISSMISFGPNPSAFDVPYHVPYEEVDEQMVAQVRDLLDSMATEGTDPEAELFTFVRAAMQVLREMTQ